METVKLMQRSIIFIESFSKQFSPHTNLLLEVLRGQQKKLIHAIFYLRILIKGPYCFILFHLDFEAWNTAIQNFII